MIILKKAIIRVLVLILSYLLFCPVWYSLEDIDIEHNHGIIKTRYGLFNWMQSEDNSDALGKPIKPGIRTFIISRFIASIITFIGMIVFVFIYEKKYLNSNKNASPNLASAR